MSLKKLTEEQQEALLAFMRTLNKDQALLVKKAIQMYINFSLSYNDPLSKELSRILEVVDEVSYNWIMLRNLTTRC